LTTALKEGGSVQLRKFAKLSLRNLLVLSQIAASVTLVLLTAALAAGYRRTMGVEVGFDPGNLFLLSLDPVRDGYSSERASALFEKLLARVQGLPSVTAASLTDTSPMWAPPPRVSFSSSGVIGSAEKLVVGKDYFETLGAPILLGRGFRRTDETNDTTAVIINERLARDFWNGANPLGRRIEIGRGIFHVVDVVRKTKTSFAIGEAGPEIYFPLRLENFAQPSINGVTLMVRTSPGFDALTALHRAISAMDTSLTPFNTFRMRDQIEQLMFVSRIGVYFHGSMGMFGLILAAIGLAGMSAYSVARRRREIGIRMALGARSADVLGLVMKEGVALIALGTVIGLAGAWAGTRVLSFFMQVTAVTTNLDLVVVAGAPLLLAALALTACYIPARQSLRIDPVVALRQE
jgi:predicted permease